MTQPVEDSDLFLSLTPERVLDAVEAAGVAVRPLCYPLNSFENRVYEVELADRSRVVAKFYRPQRWTAGEILAEHRFLSELDAEEIPVCPARPFPEGSTLAKTPGGIFYTLFDRKGGRAPAELDARGAARLGMLVGRLHVVGARRRDADRLHLTSGVAVLRLHGDLHLGNVLDRDGELRLLDFDDCMIGPAVQDLWLALGGRDAATTELREIFLESYTQFRRFDRAELRLIEPLRGLRMAHYAAWLARRWHDPIFPKNWPHFGTEESWERETIDLEEQSIVVARVERGGTAAEPAAAADEEALTNKDLFWDWDG